MIYKSEFGDIHYEIVGPQGKPAVMFFHGVGMDHRTFEKQVTALSGDYRVIVWDMPGHGRSTLKETRTRYSFLAAECTLGILDETGTGKAVLAGLSLGSFVVQQVLRKYPQRVAATVHIGAVPLYPGYSRLVKPMIPVAVAMAGLLPEKPFYRSFARHRADTQETREYMEEAIRKAGKGLVLRITRDIGDDLTEGIPEPPEHPMLIAYGENDIFTRGLSAKWHKRVPGSRRAVIPKANHVANQDNPEEFNRALVSFLEEINLA